MEKARFWEGKYLVLLIRGDVMCVGVGQSGDYHFGVIAETVSYQSLHHKERATRTHRCNVRDPQL